ncbi:MAG: hypothetical protein U9N83_19350 [Thermodesulfobacteriota bacterium]|nr:hypothetical protein [Thermodesulfobacteriota bacterium]
MEIADIRWKLMHHLTGVHPAKKNASSSTTPVIRRTANLKGSIKGYKEGLQMAQDYGREIAQKL